MILIILVILMILMILIDFLLACARGGCEQTTCKTCQQSTCKNMGSCRPTVKDYEDESAWRAPALVVDQSCQMPEFLNDMAESVSTSVSTSVGPSWPISRVLQCLPLHSTQRLVNGNGIVTSE